jgi:hypothetical protein
VRDLGASRFGAVRLIEWRNLNGTVDQYAAKYYNTTNGHVKLHAF